MANLMNRTPVRVAGAAALALIGLGALAGCGVTVAAVPASGLAETRGATALQQQFVDVVDHVSPQVVRIQTDRGLGSGIVYDRRGDVVTNADVTAGATRFLGFAIPSNTVQSVANRLIARAQAT